MTEDTANGEGRGPEDEGAEQSVPASSDGPDATADEAADQAAMIHEAQMRQVLDYNEIGRSEGAKVAVGGGRVTAGGLDKGFYVEPTVFVNVTPDMRIFREEIFGPVLTVTTFRTVDEAVDLANDTVYGLTAGVYSEDPGEVQTFLDRIQAGVLYINRRAGATTGAWPGVQAFGGWKGSGSTGKAGLSMYYVAQFLREQSHTIVD